MWHFRANKIFLPCKNECSAHRHPSTHTELINRIHYSGYMYFTTFIFFGVSSLVLLRRIRISQPVAAHQFIKIDSAKLHYVCAPERWCCLIHLIETGFAKTNNYLNFSLGKQNIHEHLHEWVLKCYPKTVVTHLKEKQQTQTVAFQHHLIIWTVYILKNLFNFQPNKIMRFFLTTKITSNQTTTAAQMQTFDNCAPKTSRNNS